jgi:hypothetical protein
VTYTQFYQKRKAARVRGDIRTAVEKEKSAARNRKKVDDVKSNLQ